jgi:hypothetical protein
MKGCLLIIGASVVNIFLWAIWSGYVLSVIWGWFVVPAFHMPYITIPVAIGLCMITRMLTVTTPEQKKELSSKEAMDALIYSFAFDFLFPLFVLGVGYIAHLFM